MNPCLKGNLLLTETYAYRNLSGFHRFCKWLPSLVVAERRDGIPENKKRWIKNKLSLGRQKEFRCRMTRRTWARTYCLQKLNCNSFRRFCKHTWKFWPGIDDMGLQQKKINKNKINKEIIIQAEEYFPMSPAADQADDLLLTESFLLTFPHFL